MSKCKIFYCVFVLFIKTGVLPVSVNDIRSQTPSNVQQKAAFDVIARILPNYSHLFEIKIDTGLQSNTFHLFKDDNTTKLKIIASSGIAACKGFHYYFKYYLEGHISWSGLRIPKIPTKLPNILFNETSKNRFTYYQNVCTWSYSFAWWKWNEWRKHIDWMALMGINLVIAPIQEHVWTEYYQELGLNKTEIDNHFAGPAFQAWQRMGNIRGWGGPLPESYKKQQFDLQKQIIAAERELGMIVALPGFAGHVPITFQRIFPNSTFYKLKSWNRFPKKYCCPLFIDPNDILFNQIGKIFLKKIIEEYGTDHIYFSDPFNENEPNFNTNEYLRHTSKSIFKAMTSVDKNAIWLLQGWMFVNNPFWTLDLIKSFLTAVPIGRILILDLQSELLPQYENTNSYFGQPFIWCMLHNFGGTLGMHGSIKIVNDRILKSQTMKNSSMIGVGITPEGINQNYCIYEFVLERAWSQDKLNITKWFQQYTKVRYGIRNQFIDNVWNDLLKSVYDYKGLIKIHGKYTICRRPNINLSPWIWYKPEIIENIWKNMLEASQLLKNEKFYQHDLVDITRQYLQNKGDQIFISIRDAYNHKNLTRIENLSKIFYILLKDLNNILLTNENFLLGNWLESAKSMGNNDMEKILYEINAKNQITLWGPNGQIVDYATKQWAGIVSDFFTPRWKLFLNELIIAVKNSEKFNQTNFKLKVFNEVEYPFIKDRKIYSITTVGDSIEKSKELFEKWVLNKELNHNLLKINIKT